MPLLQIVQRTVFQNSVTVNPYQALLAFHHQLKREPLAGLDPGVCGPFDVIQGACRKMRSFYIMQLDFVMPRVQPLAGGAKQHASIVVLRMTNEHFQPKVAEFFACSNVSHTVPPQHCPERLKIRLSVGDEPFLEIFFPLVERLPDTPAGQFVDAQVSKANGIRERLQTEISTP